jgi:hypothetical protein
MEFSGYRWLVRSSEGQFSGPGPNLFAGTPDFVNVDADGKLHLFIRKSGTIWACSEVTLSQAMGYGTYEIEVETNPFNMDRQAVFGFFTYSSSAEQNHRELDIELSYWGRPTETRNGQFVVQPSGPPGSVSRFEVNHSATIYSIHWTKKMALFTAKNVNGAVIKQWIKTENVPKTGDARPQINLWLTKGLAPQNDQSVEFIIKRFTFTPEISHAQSTHNSPVKFNR